MDQYELGTFWQLVNDVLVDFPVQDFPANTYGPNARVYVTALGQAISEVGPFDHLEEHTPHTIMAVGIVDEEDEKFGDAHIAAIRGRVHSP